MIFFIKALALFAALSIVYNSIVALNHMGWKTNHIIRFSHILMSVAAMHEVFWILQRHVPNITEALIFSGCALLLIFDNRRAYQCPMMEGNNEHYS